jgi:hypothetical protein
MAAIARSDRRRMVAGGIAAVAVTVAIASAERVALGQQATGSGCSPSPDRLQAETIPMLHVRPLGPDARHLLAEARRLSPTVRRLLAELERSDLIVYLQVQPGRLVHTGTTALLSSGGAVRYVKVNIYLYFVSDSIPWLAHELQHAVEIASAPDVRDADGVIRLYKRIGDPGEHGLHSFETIAAIDVRNRVVAELTSASSALAPGCVPR